MAIKIKTDKAVQAIWEAGQLLAGNLSPLQYEVFGNLKVIADALIEQRQEWATLYFFELLRGAQKVKNANISAPNAQSLTANFQHNPSVSIDDVCMLAAREFARKYLNDGIRATAFKAVKKTVNMNHLGVLSTTFTIICINHGE